MKYASLPLVLLLSLGLAFGGQVTETYLSNVSGTATLGTSPILEVFRNSSRATSAGTLSTTLGIAECGMFSVGDTAYVGTTASTAASPSGNVAVILGVSIASGPCNLTLMTAISWANNDAVMVKRKTGSGSDSYATIYDDEDFATSITQPFNGDSNNQWVYFLPPGRFGVRISDSSGRTLALKTQVISDEVGWVQVTPGLDSDTDGIREAINMLPSGGGVAYIPAGTYTLDPATVFAITQSNLTLLGDGRGATILQLGASATQNLIRFDGDEYMISGITFDGNSTNNTGDLTGLVFRDVSHVTIRDCEFLDWDNHTLLFDYNSTGGENILIEGNEFTNWGANGGGQAIRLDRGYSHVRILSNYLHDAPGSGADNVTAIQIGGTSDTGNVYPVTYFTASNNIIESIGLSGTGPSRGISVNAAAPATNGKTQYGVIANNVIDQTEGDAISGTNVDHLAILGNTITGGDEGGIVCLGCRWLTVTGNVVTTTGTGLLLGWQLDTVNEHASSDHVIVGNTLYELDPDNEFGVNGGGIIYNYGSDTDAKTGKRIHIADNQIHFTATTFGDYGIRLNANVTAARGTLEDVSIRNNFVESAAVTGIDVEFITDLRLFGNVSVNNQLDSFIHGNLTTAKIGYNEFDDVSFCSGISVAMVAGAGAVVTRCAHTGQEVILIHNGTNVTNAGSLFQGAILDGINFAFTSSDAADTDTVYWRITE